MAKFIMLSIVLVSMGLPLRMSSSRGPRRALRFVQWATAAFVVVWAYTCIFWYPRLVPIE